MGSSSSSGAERPSHQSSKYVARAPSTFAENSFVLVDFDSRVRGVEFAKAKATCTETIEALTAQIARNDSAASALNHETWIQLCQLLMICGRERTILDEPDSSSDEHSSASDQDEDLDTEQGQARRRRREMKLRGESISGTVVGIIDCARIGVVQSHEQDGHAWHCLGEVLSYVARKRMTELDGKPADRPEDTMPTCTLRNVKYCAYDCYQKAWKERGVEQSNEKIILADARKILAALTSRKQSSKELTPDQSRVLEEALSRIVEALQDNRDVPALWFVLFQLLSLFDISVRENQRAVTVSYDALLPRKVKERADVVDKKQALANCVECDPRDSVTWLLLLRLLVSPLIIADPFVAEWKSDQSSTTARVRVGVEIVTPKMCIIRGVQRMREDPILEFQVFSETRGFMTSRQREVEVTRPLLGMLARLLEEQSLVSGLESTAFFPARILKSNLGSSHLEESLKGLLLGRKCVAGYLLSSLECSGKKTLLEDVIESEDFEALRDEAALLGKILSRWPSRGLLWRYLGSSLARQDEEKYLAYASNLNEQTRNGNARTKKLVLVDDARRMNSDAETILKPNASFFDQPTTIGLDNTTSRFSAAECFVVAAALDANDLWAWFSLGNLLRRFDATNAVGLSDGSREIITEKFGPLTEESCLVESVRLFLSSALGQALQSHKFLWNGNDHKDQQSLTIAAAASQRLGEIQRMRRLRMSSAQKTAVFSERQLYVLSSLCLQALVASKDSNGIDLQMADLWVTVCESPSCRLSSDSHVDLVATQASLAFEECGKWLFLNPTFSAAKESLVQRELMAANALLTTSLSPNERESIAKTTLDHVKRLAELAGAQSNFALTVTKSVGVKNVIEHIQAKIDDGVITSAEKFDEYYSTSQVLEEVSWSVGNSCFPTELVGTAGTAARIIAVAFLCFLCSRAGRKCPALLHCRTRADVLAHWTAFEARSLRTLGEPEISLKNFLSTATLSFQLTSGFAPCVWIDELIPALMCSVSFWSSVFFGSFRAACHSLRNETVNSWWERVLEVDMSEGNLGMSLFLNVAEAVANLSVRQEPSVVSESKLVQFARRYAVKYDTVALLLFSLSRRSDITSLQIVLDSIEFSGTCSTTVKAALNFAQSIVCAQLPVAIKIHEAILMTKIDDGIESPVFLVVEGFELLSRCLLSQTWGHPSSLSSLVAHFSSEDVFEALRCDLTATLASSIVRTYQQSFVCISPEMNKPVSLERLTSLIQEIFSTCRQGVVSLVMMWAVVELIDASQGCSTTERSMVLQFHCDVPKLVSCRDVAQAIKSQAPGFCDDLFQCVIIKEDLLCAKDVLRELERTVLPDNISNTHLGRQVRLLRGEQILELEQDCTVALLQGIRQCSYDAVLATFAKIPRGSWLFPPAGLALAGLMQQNGHDRCRIGSKVETLQSIRSSAVDSAHSITSESLRQSLTDLWTPEATDLIAIERNVARIALATLHHNTSELGS